MGDGRAVGIGWPMSPIQRLGGLLRRVDGFLVFWRPSWGEKTNDAPLSDGSARRSTVGWPSANLLSDGTAPEEAGLDGTEPECERPAGTGHSGAGTAGTTPRATDSGPPPPAEAAPGDSSTPASSGA